MPSSSPAAVCASNAHHLQVICWCSTLGLALSFEGPRREPARLSEVRCIDGQDLNGTAVCRRLTLPSGAANWMKAMPFSSCVSRSVGRRTEAISPQSWNTSVRAWRTSSSPWYLSNPLTKIVVGSEPDESACNQKSSAPYLRHGRHEAEFMLPYPITRPPLAPSQA